MITLSGLIFACSGSFDKSPASDHVPDISPDYSNVTIPPNIAPMNFLINEKGDSYEVVIHSLNGREIIIKSADNFISIPANKWKKLLSASAGKDI
ncbi:MAG TPA: cytochrome C biosynthesis protein, partial [Bacteroidales bacterium]|nr:cytochrome C biosynthesis protein [Bacteroidales bacterium]